MNNQINFSGKFSDGKQIKDCVGNIKILRIDDKHKTAYVSWQISEANQSAIAGVTRNYFLGGVPNPQEEIVKMVLTGIKKYQVNRQKVFSEIEFK